MTITMSEKHQVTIPKKIADVLHLRKGSLFNVEIKGSRIELVPLEVTEKTLTPEDYQKLDRLSAQEKGKEEKVTKALIARLKSGKK